MNKYIKLKKNKKKILYNIFLILSIIIKKNCIKYINSINKIKKKNHTFNNKKKKNLTYKKKKS